MSQYFAYPTTVNLYAYEEILETFPSVTFCNLNPFDSGKEFVRKILEDELKENNISSNIIGTEEKPAIFQLNDIMKVLKASVLSSSNDNETYAHSLSFSLDSLLISCYFNGIKCNSSDFVKFYSFEYGSCYTFNKDQTGYDLKSTSKSGPKNGLSMEIFTGLSGY